ncbi:MAG: hypothetical protein Q8L51_02900 [Candidatus Amesbacteria bacterium]|nr:hypothetical protein [Candidatus Amesbacteria bacterium]
MKEIRLITLSLSEVNPSNLPFIDQWRGVKNYKYTNIHRDIFVVDHHEHGILTRDGNHRLGKLAQLRGSDTKIKVLLVEDQEGEGYWEDMLTKTRAKNVFDYDDFWRFAIANFGE